MGVGGQGELSFEQDQLVAGGQLGELHNGTQYREVRQFCSGSGHHLVRFYFLTRVYSEYLEDVLEELSYGPAPDLVIINSCLWDLSRFRRGERERTGWRWRYGSIPVLLPTPSVNPADMAAAQWRATGRTWNECLYEWTRFCQTLVCWCGTWQCLWGNVSLGVSSSQSSSPWQALCDRMWLRGTSTVLH